MKLIFSRGHWSGRRYQPVDGLHESHDGFAAMGHRCGGTLGLVCRGRKSGRIMIGDPSGRIV